MPYTIKNVPDTIKNLPKSAQRIWIDTFNAVVKDNSEEEARKAAWKNVKLKYKKEGDSWVKKDNANESMKLHITNSEGFVRLAEGQEGTKKGVYRVITPGWSGNGFYYSKEVTAQLVPFIEGKPMFFADHLEPNAKKDMIFGQKLKESAVAIAEEAWADADTGEVFVKLNPFTNSNSWIYEASQAYPEHIGLSIDAYGKVQVGEVEGKKGKIVKQFTGYDSTDFVYRPAAGGKFISLTEAIALEDVDDFNFQEAISSFKEYLEKKEKKSTFYMIGNYLIEFLYEIIVWNYDLTKEEKQEIFDKALTEFIDKIKEIDPVNLFNANLISSEDNKSYLENLQNKLTEVNMTEELKKALEGLTPEILRSLNPALYSQFQESVTESLKIEDTTKKVDSLQKEVNELLEKVSALNDENKKLKDDLEAKDKELNEFKEAEKAHQWSEGLNKLLQESGIDQALITETFKEALNETKDLEKAKKLIEDRKEIASKRETSFDNSRTNNSNAQEQETAVEIDEKQLINSLKGKK